MYRYVKFPHIHIKTHKYKSSSHIYTSRCININQVFVHLDVYMCKLDLYLCILMCTCANLIYICLDLCTLMFIFANVICICTSWCKFANLDVLSHSEKHTSQTMHSIQSSINLSEPFSTVVFDNFSCCWGVQVRCKNWIQWNTHSHAFGRPSSCVLMSELFLTVVFVNLGVNTVYNRN